MEDRKQDRAHAIVQGQMDTDTIARAFAKELVEEDDAKQRERRITSYYHEIASILVAIAQAKARGQTSVEITIENRKFDLQQRALGAIAKIGYSVSEKVQKQGEFIVGYGYTKYFSRTISW